MRSAVQSAATTMKQHTITTLPPSPDADRRARMIKYTIAMSIRVLCIVLMLFVQGWWLAVCAAGAIFLPYIAVVLANVGGGEQGVVERPGSIVPVARPDSVGPAADTGAGAPADAPVDGATDAAAGSTGRADASSDQAGTEAESSDADGSDADGGDADRAPGDTREGER
ncbi:DUF3099 domain-containing protein [Agromyces aerolatus]|uniref:DUF3099 domain-containing protein n=1 Tax=Agromyces sp. LY-1074 TaxID=3074080 RepID=UPI00285B25E4|nr:MULTISPECIES: DUF3099 domain-containing protein [unclassified Agromyces]MDR5700061.1 DUF3099 domain-containing protein [Agromyces sp. LY-1074]MDR5706571.1 DUF3099 domain-containing protein [Agromyces sp. LY-1358]